jgi:hypothetical protein
MKLLTTLVQAYLQENSYDLTNALLSGASAGALSATIAKTSINPYKATELALQMSDEAGVWERPLGLMGIWGDIIYRWLDDLLPIDVHTVVNDQVCEDAFLPLLKVFTLKVMVLVL